MAVRVRRYGDVGVAQPETPDVVAAQAVLAPLWERHAAGLQAGAERALERLARMVHEEAQPKVGGVPAT